MLPGRKSIADGKAHVIGGHDLANLVPVSVKEAFLVMCQAPFGHDAAAPGNDPGHASGGEGNKAQQDSRMDREIVDTLFSLFDQRIAIDFPREFFSFSGDFFQRLVDGNRADGNR